MIRVFRHYLHRETLLKILIDIGLLVLLMVGVDIIQAQTSNRGLQLAASHGLSLAVGIFIINSTSGLYQPSHSGTVPQSCVRALLAMMLGLPLAYAIFGLLPSGVGNGPATEWAVMIGVVGVIAHRAYANHSSAAPRIQSRIMIFGSGPEAILVGSALKSSDPHAQIVGYYAGPNEKQSTVPVRELLSGQQSLRECAIQLNVDEIVVALGERRGGSMPLRELLDCKTGGIRVSDISTHFEKTSGQIKLDYVNAGWLIFGDGFNRGIYPGIVKRLFDIVCTLILLALAAPVILFTICLIFIESKGPIFYRQERVGCGGKSFNVLKFRSMKIDAEKNGTPRWAAAQDDRTTRVGRVIRRFRIDEIPQLLNVLKGDMSLVGPRPERPFFVEQLTREIPYYAVRQSVKPGITGWAQVRYQYGANLTDSREKLQYDLYYVKNHTLFLDLVILFETVDVVASGRGAR